MDIVIGITFAIVYVLCWIIWELFELMLSLLILFITMLFGRPTWFRF